MLINKLLAYQCKTSFKATIIYYIAFSSIILSLYIIALLFSSKLMMTSEVPFQIQGIEISTFIFLFILAIANIETDFKFFLQIGVTRKKLLITSITSFLLLALSMAAFELILNLFFSSLYNLEYSTLFAQIYDGFSFTFAYLWTFLFYLIALFSGFFINILYHFIGKKTFYILMIVLLILLIVGLPLFTIQFPHLVTRVLEAILFCMGYTLYGSEVMILNPFLSMLVILIILISITYCLLRKLELKD